MVTYTLNNISLNDLSDALNKKNLHSVFSSKAWLNFLTYEVGGKFIGVCIKGSNGSTHYFFGILFKKLGLKIIGSPFPGWGTSYMGIVGENSLSKGLISSLFTYLFNKYSVHYIETVSQLKADEIKSFDSYQVSEIPSLLLPINEGIESLYGRLKGDCRTFLRQFNTKGGVLKITSPDDQFIDIFYRQLSEVFRRQGMIPTHSYSRIKNMLKMLESSEIDLLCLQAYGDSSQPIASSIFFGLNGVFYYWAGASSTIGQHYRPNESMIWKAICYFENLGYQSFDMMGERNYKLKFSPDSIAYVSIKAARPLILFKFREMLQALYFLFNRIYGTFSSLQRNHKRKISPNLELNEILPYEFMHYQSDDMCIYSNKNVVHVTGVANHEIELPVSLIKSVLIKSRVIRRIMRLDKSCVIPSFDGLIIFWQGGVYYWSDKSGLTQTLTMKNCRNPMHNAVACIDSQTFIFGEYGTPNPKGKNIYKTNDGGKSWWKIYNFSASEIRHVHSCIWDKYTNRVWVFTGDFDGECKIMSTTVDFKDIVYYGDETQTYRATGAFIDKRYVHWVMDSPLKKVYHMRLEKETGKITRGQSFPGPVYYYTKTQDGVHLVCTAQEPGVSLTDNKVHIFASRKLKKWTNVGGFEHDGMPKRIFRFGVGVFPAGIYASDDIPISFDSVREFDGKVVKFRLKGV